MAKAASPVRLQSVLMQAAELTAKRYHRSTAEQIEYWADLGRQVVAVLDPDTLLQISSGLAKIEVQQVKADPIDPEQVFRQLEEERLAGILPASVSSAAILYQVSEEHPGYLEQIHSGGKKTVGSFENGEFIAMNALQS